MYVCQDYDAIARGLADIEREKQEAFFGAQAVSASSGEPGQLRAQMDIVLADLDKAIAQHGGAAEVDEDDYDPLDGWGFALDIPHPIGIVIDPADYAVCRFHSTLSHRRDAADQAMTRSAQDEFLAAYFLGLLGCS